MTSSDIQKKAMLEALEASLGVVSQACRQVDISRQTHYRWMQEDKEYKEAVADIGEMAIDTVETQLHKLIKGGDTTATIFFLKCRGKKRGYVEKQEFGFTDNEGNDVPVTIFQLPDNGRNQDNQAAAGIPDEGIKQPG